MPLPRLAMRRNAMRRNAMPLPRLAMRRNAMPLPRLATRRNAMPLLSQSSRHDAMPLLFSAEPSLCYRVAPRSQAFPLRYFTQPSHAAAKPWYAEPLQSEASRRNAFAIQSHALPLQYEASPCLAVAMLPQQCFAVAYLGNAIRCRCHAGPSISLPLRRTAAQCLCNQPRTS